MTVKSILRTLRLAAILLVSGVVLTAAAAYLADMGAEPTYDMVEVEPGRRLHTLCEGPDNGPFVLYDAGAFGIYADGWWVKEALKDEFRVCLYDRAGMGWSDPVPGGVEPSPEWHVEDMRRLAAAVGAQRDYFLVGHSMSGLRLHTFVNLYPQEVAGLVFVDAVGPGRFAPSRGRQIMGIAKVVMGISTMTARLGLTRPIAYLLADEFQLDADQLKDKRRSVAWVSHHKAAAAEIGAVRYDGSYFEIVNAKTKPMAVFSNDEDGGSNAALARQAAETAGYGYVESLPDESHVSLLNRRNAAKIAEAVRAITAIAQPADRTVAAQ